MAKARGIVWGRAFSPVQAGHRSAVAGQRQNSRRTVATASDLRRISSGPGRLAEALGVTRERDNEKSFVSARSDLQIMDDGYRVRRITVTPRIGIVKSAEYPLRYFIAGNKFVSGRLPTG
jgi:DNA-3-methyladenine glycosylase